MVGRRVVAGPLKSGCGLATASRGQKVPGFRFDGNGGSFQTAAVKISGENWSRYTETGEVSPHWRMQGKKGSKSKGRKAALAEIAKIPFPLAQHIARCFKSSVAGV